MCCEDVDSDYLFANFCSPLAFIRGPAREILRRSPPVSPSNKIRSDGQTYRRVQNLQQISRHANMLSDPQTSSKRLNMELGSRRKRLSKLLKCVVYTLRTCLSLAAFSRL